MRGWPYRGISIRLHGRPRSVNGLIEVHLERDRAARDESESDILPVLAGEVLDNGPTLQEQLALPVHEQAVGGPPQRSFEHVANAHPPQPVTGKGQPHRTP